MAAQPASPDENFEEGKRLYFDLEYELAVFRFRDAARAADWSDARRATAYAWLGLAYAQIAELTSAKEAFVEAARLDPAVSLATEASPPPKAVQLMQEAKTEVANAPPPKDPPLATGTTTGTNAAGAAGRAPAQPTLLPALLLYSGVGVIAGSLVAAAIGGGFGFVALSEQEAGKAAVFQDEAAQHEQAAQGAALGANLSFGVAAGLLLLGGAALGASFVVE